MFKEWVVILMSSFKAIIGELVGEHISFEFQFRESDMKPMVNFAHLKPVKICFPMNHKEILIKYKFNVKICFPKIFFLGKQRKKPRNGCVSYRLCSSSDPCRPIMTWSIFYDVK